MIGPLSSGGRVVQVGGGSPLSPDYTPQRLDDFTQYNTSFLASPVVDNGGSAGWSIPLRGGVGTTATNPFTAWHAIGNAPLLDAYRRPIVVTREWLMVMGLRLLDSFSSFAAGQDINVLVGICSASSHGPTNRGVGLGALLRPSGRLISTQSSAAADGTWTVAQNVSVSTPALLEAAVAKLGRDQGRAGFGSGLVLCPSWARWAEGDTANWGLTPDASANEDNDGWADSTPYPFVAAYRSSTTDTTSRTITVQPRRRLGLQWEVP